MAKSSSKAAEQVEKFKELIRPVVSFCEAEHISYALSCGAVPEGENVVEVYTSFNGYDNVMALMIDDIFANGPGIVEAYKKINTRSFTHEKK